MRRLCWWLLEVGFEAGGGAAARDVVVQLLVAWPLGMAIFVAPGAWQVVASRLGW